MKTIAVVSSVGGAGRTMLTVSLAGLLMARKHPALAVECDPRNVLTFYCGSRAPARQGLVSQLLSSTDDWSDAALQTEDGVLWLPWGGARGDGRGPEATSAAAIATALHEHPTWLRDLLAQVDLPGHGVALVDTPTWPSVHASQAIAAADLVLVVLPPQPLACATLPRLRSELKTLGKEAVYVANALSPASQLHTDIIALLRDTLGKELSVYRVHADAGIPEALARNESFVQSAPHSQAAHDMQGLASWLSNWIRAASLAATSARGGTA
ncbi:cellulose biosynthesis protein BcsQ [Dyella telluris]|uniref:Cellulose synthase operon protein YhjQ n=1 Tax=Dyella telluris TaxID=2763498 RepID=A0A7G8Q2B8_9GAMM|nr:cellulose biosynthesis protein BcsQ [Dyella telluris]QNK00926.1 cellulose synthase operon protein YhjQ [Dyella telluris]